jgi:MFS superfamily sulfate permease-like transporter
MKFPPLQFRYIREDLLAGVSLFLITIPLCLGIALASGAPLFAGVLSGIVGGIFLGYWSGSEVAVSGPAAGLTVIVLQAIHQLGYASFLVALIIAGVLQFILGYIKAGRLSGFFPNSTIRGMIVAIGLVIILKQIPHALGWDTNMEGEFEFSRSASGENTFTRIWNAVKHMEPGALIITFICIVSMIVWDRLAQSRKGFFHAVPSSLIVIMLGVGVNELLAIVRPGWYLGNSAYHMVQFPAFQSWSEFVGAVTFPDFSALSNYNVYILALTLALVASLESLITLEASDRIDPQRRYSSPNQELRAQGVSNIICGFIGALPVTAVFVRTSTNIFSGGKTRLSTMVHGVLLFISLVAAGPLLRLIPLASLAALLIVIGYRLADYQIFKKFYKDGKDQFVPFIITVVAIIFTDLLTGILVGLAVGIVFVLYFSFTRAIRAVREGKNVLVVFSKDVSFLNKSHLKEILVGIKEGDSVLFDGARAQFIDKDIYNTLEQFRKDASQRNIEVEFRYITHRDLSTQKSNGTI